MIKATEPDPNIRLLKAVVIGLGLVILAAMAAIVFAVVNLVGEGAPGQGRGDAAGAFHATLAIPAGSQVVRIVAAGENIALHLDLGEGGERIMLIDPRSGEKLGEIDVVTER
jgi:hypothetical protein